MKIRFSPTSMFPFVCAALVVPLLALERDKSGYAGGVDFKYLAIAYLLFFISTLATLRRRSALRRFTRAQDLPVFFFFLAIAAQALFSQNPSVAVNLALMILVFISIRCASMEDQFFRSLANGSLVFLVFLVLSLVVLGGIDERWVGGIHPNIYSGIGLAATILAMFGSTRRFEFVATISLAAAILVSSRFAIASIVVIYCLFWAINFRLAGSVRVLVALTGLFALVAQFIAAPESSIIGVVFELGDARRGLGSGLSGRDGHWAMFMPQFMQKPLLGYGFRQKAEYYTAHNGFLNVALETGFLGFTTLIFFYLTRGVSLFSDLLRSSRGQLRGRLFVAYVGIFIGAMLQPQLFSFGDPFGFISLVMLFSMPAVERSATAPPRLLPRITLNASRHRRYQCEVDSG